MLPRSIDDAQTSVWELKGVLPTFCLKLRVCSPSLGRRNHSLLRRATASCRRLRRLRQHTDQCIADQVTQRPPPKMPGLRSCWRQPHRQHQPLARELEHQVSTTPAPGGGLPNGAAHTWSRGDTAETTTSSRLIVRRSGDICRRWTLHRPTSWSSTMKGGYDYTIPQTL